MLAFMNAWAIFIDQLLREFRETTYSMQYVHGIKNFSSKFSNLKAGRAQSLNQATIKDIENALKIKIDDSNQDNITYTRIDDHSKSTGNITQTNGQTQMAGQIDINKLNINESSVEYVEILQDRIKRLELELAECHKKLKVK